MDASLRLVADRRHSARVCTAAEHEIVQARVRPGHEASVVDISCHGTLIETAHRLLPGRHVELQFDRNDQTTGVRGRVVRCTVKRVLPSAVAYQAAIGFDKPLGWPVVPKRDEYPVRTAPTIDR